jgi:transcriptional regulator with XRE-family HTH domain
MNLILKNKRIKQKLTQVKIAKLVGISERAYQDYEASKRAPNVYTTQLIAQALHTTVEELFPLPASANAGEDKPDDSQENK